MRNPLLGLRTVLSLHVLRLFKSKGVETVRSKQFLICLSSLNLKHLRFGLAIMALLFGKISHTRTRG